MGVKKWLTYGIFCVMVPIVILAGILLFREKQYAWITLCVSILSCIPFFLHFERRDTDGKRLIVIAVMVALSVLGRFLFAPIPGFKPITGMVMITALYFGKEAGFMTGALSALISNFYFGHGPWTPFQMFSWGIIGFLAGIFADPIKRSRIVQILFAILSGVAFSMLMDVYTVLWMDETFRLTRYLAAMAASLQFTVIYAVSNVIFLLVLIKPMEKILMRIKTKYGI